MDAAPCPPLLTDDDPLERAMSHLEARAHEALSLDELAEVAGVSAYHFVRQFSARFGQSPMAFARARRLGLAARRLGGDAPVSLVELAFDVGFESQEGFTRAFKPAFGVSPGRYRRRAATPSTENPAMSEVTTPLRLRQEAKPRSEAGFRVVGFSGVFDDTNKAGIPKLWERLAIRLPLPGQVSHRTFGVCWGDGHGGDLHYLAGALLQPGAPIPEGLEAMDVPAQTYLVFRQSLEGAELHPQMQAATKEIWGQRLPKSGYKLARGPDLEVYPDHFEPGVPDSWVEWWIPVEA
jgi:AraC family transcriptional regulator